MDELIDLIIELLYSFKYGRFLNKNKDFSKDLEEVTPLDPIQSEKLINLVNEQNEFLKISMIGTPTYVLFIPRRNGLFKAFVINENKKYCCRLNDIDLKDLVGDKKCFIKL